MKIESSRFVLSAFKAEDEPTQPGADIIFLGRSNVGKSSLINRLLGTKGLAKTSSTPGRTQSCNFYRINETFWMVDLPGYGYAKVPLEIRKQWQPMMEGFLERRADRNALSILVVDARRDPTQLDLVMRDWLAERGMNFLVVATKADKLSGNARQKSLKNIKTAYGSTPAGPPILISAADGRGIPEVWRHIDAGLLGAGESDS